MPDRARAELSGKFDAALATASTQNGAASTGPHAQTKAVHLSATTVIGLERSLAHKSISRKTDVRYPLQGTKQRDAHMASTD